MISYAQNHEDVLLERCFRDQERGFYIDVGAWDPITDSVTQHFYARGWNGINVEPVTEFFERLELQRPRDVNLQCILGDRIGTRALNVIEGSGLSTTRDLDASFIEDLAGIGFAMEVVEVRETTLAEICAEHVPNGAEIDFLKVDVEGAEADVLRGANWKLDRPRVLVIEAIRPVVMNINAPLPKAVDASIGWEPPLLESGYLFAATDGVNRFYVREEDAVLLEHFRVPVNVLDLYVPYTTWVAEQEAATARGELVVAEQAARELEARNREGDQRIAELLASKSWVLTAPMRVISEWLRRM